MPYAPQVSYSGANNIFEGMQAGKRNLMMYLAKFMGDKEEEKGVEESIAGLGKLHEGDAAFEEKFKKDFERVGKMSPSQKKAFAGTLAGYATTQFNKARMENMEADNKRGADMLDISKKQFGLAEKAATDKEEGAKALEGYTRDFIEGPGFGVPSSLDVMDEGNSPMGRARFAIGRNPRAGALVADDLARFAGAEAGRKPSVAGKAQRVTLEDGRVRDGIWTSDGQLQLIPPPDGPMDAVAKPIKDPQGNEVAHYVMGPDHKPRYFDKPRTQEGRISGVPMPKDPNDPTFLLPGGATWSGTESEFNRRRSATNAPPLGAVAPPAAAPIPPKPFNAPETDQAREMALKHLNNPEVDKARKASIRARFLAWYGEEP